MINVDELAQVIREVDGNHSLGAGALAEAILAKLPQFAARQPVGQEPAVYGIRVKGTVGFVGVLHVKLKDFPIKNPEWEDRYEEVPLYAAPPAQGIDLGQFQALAEFGIDFAEGVESRPNSIVVLNQAQHLLALIGQCDAAPGV